jgi:MFS transporter, CP family, cyanate transporter
MRSSDSKALCDFHLFARGSIFGRDKTRSDRNKNLEQRNSLAKSRSSLTALALLWLVGNALRMPLLAVPPVIPVLRSEFHLSGTEIGILTGLPIILFAAAALVGSWLVALLGVTRAVIAGLALTAVGGGLRALAPDVISLLGATAVMGAGIAVTQPALAALVGRWLPDRIVLGTGIYTNGLIVGEILPVALFPLLFPLLGDSWRGTFVFWTVPIVVIALLILMLAPPEQAAVAGAQRRWWPNWPAREVLRLGSVFAGASAIYFGSNAFLPGYLSEAGRTDLISPALTALNTGQLPASLLLIFFARYLERRGWPFVVAGLLCLACIGVIVATAGAVTVVSAGVLGFAAGAAFALGLTLPPLMSAPDEVARVSAAMFTFSYTSALVVSVLSGAAWDLTGEARIAFLPVALSGLPAILLVPTMRFGRAAFAAKERSP